METRMSAAGLEPLAIFAGGLLGSGHCVGMCGGFVVNLGLMHRSWKLNLGRQLLYGTGRVFTYVGLGVAGGYLGAQLEDRLPSLVHVQAWLCVAAGLLLVVQGLHSLGLFQLRTQRSERCVAPGMFGDLLRASTLHSVFFGGVVNGFLPCGLVYAFLALAGSTRQPLAGGLVMLLFGIGTIPVLALVGVGAGTVGVGLRRKLLAAAAVCVIATGGLSLWRGWQFLQDRPHPEATCPLCEGASEKEPR